MARTGNKSKKKLKPMTDEEVTSYVVAWLEDSLDYYASDLSEQRSQALKYYLGEPFGNERKGKSQVVSRDIQETVDWIMPSLLKVFSSGDCVVRYDPQGQTDVDQAEQETEYVNYLFTRKNKGFTILHDWFQDALMMKTGVVKVWVEEENEPRFDYYTGLTEDMILDILSEPYTELLGQQQDFDGTYRIKIKCSKPKRHIKCAAIPPEEFLIDRDARCLEDARFCAHRKEMSVSELRAMGVPEDVIEGLPYDTFDLTESSPERITRDFWDGSGDFPYQAGVEHEANRKVWVSECYVELDVDGDGIAELRKVLVSGNYVISNDEASCRPFAVLSAHRIAHKFYGMSIYDKIKDIQEIRSTLMRNILDNVYRLNTGRYQVLEGQVNLDDLTTNEAAGIVRVKSMNAVSDLPTPALSGDVYQMLDRLEADRGKRTGVTDRSRGLDSNTLHSNQAATSVNQMMTAAEQQIDLIARMFAETGVKDLFQLLHDYAIKYQDQEEVFELRGKYIPVNPSSWRERYDLVVTVGIGNMNKDQQLLHLSRMFEMAQAIVANNGLGVLITEKGLYNMLTEMSKNAGYRDYSRFWQDPDSPEAQQEKQRIAEAQAKPTPDDIKAQADMARAQADAQAKQATAQLEMARIELEKMTLAIKEREIALKEAELDLEAQRFVWERARDEAEHSLEAQQARAVAIGDGQVPQKKVRGKGD